jgi:hypothetical protein
MRGNAGANGGICRSVSLSGAANASMTFVAKRNSGSGSTGWDSTDRAYVEASTTNCSSGFTTLMTFSSGGASGTETLGTGYDGYDINLDAYAGGTVYLRWRPNMTVDTTNEEFYVDTIVVSTGMSGSPNGFLNGNDGSNPANCDSEQKPRERQMDVRTIELAQAIKAQGVEIFIVAFAGGVANCELDYPDLIYDDDNPAHCGTVVQNTSYPIGQSGPDGDDPKPATNPNVRLLKCIASSTNGTDDHYFFANSASELQGIFTKIANQIAHRLIE